MAERWTAVCCLQENEASRRVNQKNGGVYESTVHEPEGGAFFERYWIRLLTLSFMKLRNRTNTKGYDYEGGLEFSKEFLSLKIQRC